MQFRTADHTSKGMTADRGCPGARACRLQLKTYLDIKQNESVRDNCNTIGAAISVILVDIPNSTQTTTTENL